MAVRHADEILWWHENLSTEDVPPRWTWHLPWELDEHFKALDARRNSTTPADTREQVPLVDNEAAAEWRRLK